MPHSQETCEIENRTENADLLGLGRDGGRLDTIQP